jgi:hypothetical protein
MYCNSLNTHTFGDDIELAFSQLTQAESLKKAVFSDPTTGEDYRTALTDFYSQVTPLVNEITREHKKHKSAQK